ncbi:MAG: UDP-3-O-(3-hydroxymyristoyl)glucosamine N-acyltransferase [Nitrospirae bacterium]|nr:UDP-3-O-(3-hydroxymyristoyl)glucosamine N-acyltransferase [Nitrospirota bacterium]
MREARRLDEIAALVNGVLAGDGSVVVTGVAGLREAGPGDLTFVAASRSLPDLGGTRASAAIVPLEVEAFSIPVIRVENPHFALAKVLGLMYDRPRGPGFVSDRAVLGRGVRLGRDAQVYPHVFVGDGTEIGDRAVLYPGVCVGDRCYVGNDAILYPNVTLREDVSVGARSIVHAGAVLGADGFGFVEEAGRHHKIPQVGRVVIEDDVEIGANVCIDRATLGKTVVRRGTKIDNLVQIAHNVTVGEDCLIVAQVGISGSVEIGNHVTLAGQVGVAGHLKIGDRTIVGAQSGVTKSIPADSRVTGFPPVPHGEWLRAQASIPKIPEMRKRIAELEERVKVLERALRRGEKES